MSCCVVEGERESWVGVGERRVTMGVGGERESRFSWGGEGEGWVSELVRLMGGV